MYVCTIPSVINKARNFSNNHAHSSTSYGVSAPTPAQLQPNYSNISNQGMQCALHGDSPLATIQRPQLRPSACTSPCTAWLPTTWSASVTNIAPCTEMNPSRRITISGNISQNLPPRGQACHSLHRQCAGRQSSQHLHLIHGQRKGLQTSRNHWAQHEWLASHQNSRKQVRNVLRNGGVKQV